MGNSNSIYNDFKIYITDTSNSIKDTINYILIRSK